MSGPSSLLRHVLACNNARLPGARIGFSIGGDRVGWVRPGMATALTAFEGVHSDAAGITLTDPAALADIVKTLSEQGYFRLRHEAFDVRATPDGPALTTIDRGAIPSFCVEATGVHVNGLVQHTDGLRVWIARRAGDKQLDPGKLDHIVAGGVPAGLSVEETLIKEAAEEAAIPPELAATARRVATFRYAMERAEGLRRDRLGCYDLVLPPDFTPSAVDGEVESFELWPAERVLQTVRETDDFKFNVNLVLIDLFIRCGMLPKTEADTLRAALLQG